MTYLTKLKIKMIMVYPNSNKTWKNYVEFKYNKIIRNTKCKPITQINDKYILFIDGRIYSYLSNSFLSIKGKNNKKNYVELTLTDRNKKLHYISGQKLVLETFTNKNIIKENQIHHINHKEDDNHFLNLVELTILEHQEMTNYIKGINNKKIKKTIFTKIPKNFLQTTTLKFAKVLGSDEHYALENGKIISTRFNCYVGEETKSTQKERYLRVSIKYKGKKIYNKVNKQKIIWEAFNGKKIPDDMEVHHKNHNRRDNSISNLELLTHKDNNKKNRKEIDIKKIEHLYINKKMTMEEIKKELKLDLSKTRLNAIFKKHCEKNNIKKPKNISQKQLKYIKEKTNVDLIVKLREEDKLIWKDVAKIVNKPISNVKGVYQRYVKKQQEILTK